MPLAQQGPDHPECLLEAIAAMVERQAESGELRRVPAGSQAEDEAAIADLVEGVRLFGHQCRVAEAQRRRHCPDLHPTGDHCQRREEGPRFPEPDGGLVGDAVEEVVGQPHRGISQVLGRDGLLPEVLPARRLVRRRRPVRLRDALMGREDDADLHLGNGIAALQQLAMRRRGRLALAWAGLLTRTVGDGSR